MKSFTNIFVGSLLLSSLGAFSVSSASAAPSKPEPKLEAEVLQDDILAVLDLPLVIHAASSSGLARADLDLVLKTSVEAGLSAGEAAMIIDAEVARAKEGGVDEGFGRWVRKAVADGARGKALADRIATRKPDKPKGTGKKLEAAQAKQEAKLAAKLQALKVEREAEQKTKAAKKKQLVEAGKPIDVLWKSNHERHVRALEADKSGLVAAKAKLAKTPPGQGVSAEKKGHGHGDDFVAPGQAKKAESAEVRDGSGAARGRKAGSGNEKLASPHSATHAPGKSGSAHPGKGSGKGAAKGKSKRPTSDLAAKK